MAFVGFDKEDGEPLYDTKEAAIERARMLKKWNDPDAQLWILRDKRIPLWFAHLVRDTWFMQLAYTRIED